MVCKKIQQTKAQQLLPTPRPRTNQIAPAAVQRRPWGFTRGRGQTHGGGKEGSPGVVVILSTMAFFYIWTHASQSPPLQKKNLYNQLSLFFSSFVWLSCHTLHTAPNFWKPRHVGVQCHKSGSGNCFGDIFSFHLARQLAGFLVEEHVGKNCGELSSMIYIYMYMQISTFLHVRLKHVCVYILHILYIL